MSVREGSELPKPLADLHRKTHQTIKKVTEDIGDRFHFNTAIAAVMELVNQMYLLLEQPSREGLFWAVMKSGVENMILLIAPIVPHIAEELWQALGHTESVATASWPKWNEEALQAEEVLVVVQVNGRLRSRILVPLEATTEQIEQAAVQDPRTRDFIGGKTIRKIVVVPGKLVNIVV